MREILGNNLKQFFSHMDKYEVESRLTYKGERYEVWEVDDDLFPEMRDMSEEKFLELAGEDSWWRSSPGSNIGTPDAKAYVNGCEMLCWNLDDEDVGDKLEIYSSNLSDYLCNVVGASLPRNVCSVAMDLSKHNGMTMSELFTKYEG